MVFEKKNKVYLLILFKTSFSAKRQPTATHFSVEAMKLYFTWNKTLTKTELANLAKTCFSL